MKRLITRLALIALAKSYILATLLVVAAAGLSAARAETTPAPVAKSGGVALSDASHPKAGLRASFDSWLKDLRKRVARTRAHQNQLVAVAAVRGAETSDAPPLYWKGRKSSGPVDVKELDEFEKAVDTAGTDPAAARAQFQAFLTAHPKSPLAADANTALAKMDVGTTAP